MLEVQMTNGDIFLTEAVAFGLIDVIFFTYDLNTEQWIQLSPKCKDILRIIQAGNKMKYEL